MLRCLLVALSLYGLIPVWPAFAAGEFRKDNPDIMKYQFARSYITALRYMKDVDDRWNKNAPKKRFAHDKKKMILATIDDLTLDSSDLLVIKGYLLKYLQSPNMLMRKVADTVVVAVSEEVAINRQEKNLWEKWYDLNAAGQATRPKEIEFVKNQYDMELRRKEADKKIIQASVMMTKVMISDKNPNGKGHLLAITARQRQELLDKLDSFGGGELDWGLRAGQTPLQASISVIREMLEDSIWKSIDEK
ncbi:MAG: hypothetical protein KGK03_05430 [Candidatus Omnitrophica bacterium]|nr:hypothetical protein [Candidatus Omnitrophota bacterium]MDE2222498.1 hypothetical protein [Candidatus Omnitrophota bacterium]